MGTRIVLNHYTHVVLLRQALKHELPPHRAQTAYATRSLHANDSYAYSASPGRCMHDLASVKFY